MFLQRHDIYDVFFYEFSSDETQKIVYYQPLTFNSFTIFPLLIRLSPTFTCNTLSEVNKALHFLLSVFQKLFLNQPKIIKESCSSLV